MDLRTDQELIVQINRGQTEAFETLYFRYRDWVYQLAWRMILRNDLAEDIVQEVFIYLLGKVPNLILTCQMKSFLYPVARHTALNLIKKERRTVSDDELLSGVPSIPNESPDANIGDLAIALGNLKASQREVVLMRFVDGMTLEEIAGALEQPLNTVKSHLYRSLDILREDPKARNYFLPD